MEDMWETLIFILSLIKTRISILSLMKVPPPHKIPDLSSENTPEVHTLNSSLLHNIDDSISHKLPFRHNREKPLNRYSPNRESKGERYPIAHHISTQRLSEPLKAFAHKLFTEYIPHTVHEALRDPQWTQAIMDKMTTL